MLNEELKDIISDETLDINREALEILNIVLNDNANVDTSKTIKKIRTITEKIGKRIMKIEHEAGKQKGVL